MPELTFYGGVGEIGGNKILFQDGDTRVFLDFGMSFGRVNTFYDKFMRPRSKGGLRDLLGMGLVPPLDGIYREDLLHVAGIEEAIEELGIEERSYWAPGLKSYGEILERDESPWLDGVLLTHAHLDHCQYITLLDPRVPIYCSETTKRILEVADEIGNSDFLGVKPLEVDHYQKGMFPGTPKIKGGDEVTREFRTFRPGDKFKVEGLQVETFAVDHSVPGCVAFRITTSDGKRIVYTGDFRFHGRHADKTQRFREAVRGTEPDALICEGTHIESTELDSEAQVERECTDMISGARGLVAVEFAWKDLTRFETVRKAAREAGRKFAISARTAYLLNKLGRGKEVEDDPDVLVYVPRKDSMIYAPGDYTKSKYAAGYSSDWGADRDIHHLEDGVRAYQIAEDPSRWVLHLGYFEFNELLDIQPPEGGLFISASSEPYDEEGTILEEKRKAWLERFRFNLPDFDLPHVHASGHACGPELKEFVEDVRPRALFPIHTEHPELFEGLAEKVYERIEPGKSYEV